MKYSDFERVISKERLRRYLIACNNDTRKAMLLYRYNLKISKEMFLIISCFEVALRNNIDNEMKKAFGYDWLRDSILKNGIFYNDKRAIKTKAIIEYTYYELNNNGSYTHSKLLTEMGFGVWKYMFNNAMYSLSGKCLLRVFPNKSKSSSTNKYNNTYIFNELDKINILRNRIAHHEPICFKKPAHIDTSTIKNCYDSIMTLFSWMNINHKNLLYGLDHIDDLLEKFKNF